MRPLSGPEGRQGDKVPLTYVPASRKSKPQGRRNESEFFFAPDELGVVTAVSTPEGIRKDTQKMYTTSPCVVSLPLPPHRRGFAFSRSENLNTTGRKYGIMVGVHIDN